MRYEDEVASTQTLVGARRKAYTKDVENFITKFELLHDQSENQTARIRLLEEQLRRARKDGKQFASRLSSLSIENKQLKSLVSALRGSKSMKLGRFIGKPGVIVRELSPYKFVSSRIKASGSQGTKQTGLPVVGSVASNPTQQETARYAAVILADLQESFYGNRSKENLQKLLAHHYFVRGDLMAPAKLIRENRDLGIELAAADQNLINKIEGQAIMLSNQVALPPVQPNIGYFAERNRIMYCVHSTGDFDSNGYSTRTTGLVSGMEANQQDIVVVARPGYPWDSKTVGLPKKGRREVRTNDGVDFIYTPGPNLGSDRLDIYVSEAADVFVREAIRNRTAVIHSASNYLTALPALIAARRLGIPFVYEVRGLWEVTELSRNPSWESSDRFRLAATLEAFVAKEADSVLAITSQVADALVARGANRENIELLPNAVDTNVFKPMPRYSALADKLNLNRDSVVIGYAGSIVDYEGLSVLLDSVKILVERDRDVRVVIVGDGPELGNLKQQVTSLSIDDIVQFTGRVPAVDIPNYISLFDIMPCPRLRLPVTEMVSPLKPLEIMASGKALVLSNLAPSRDLAGEAESRAVISEPDDALSLANALDQLILDTKLRDRLGREARIWAVAERTWEKVAQVAIDTYQRIQDRHESPIGRSLSELTVAIIADEFTLTGIRPEVQTLELDPARWRDQFKEGSVDLLFVESAWSGNSGAWQGKVGFYDHDSFNDLKDIVNYCRQSGIPTIFWNKEDPVHFNRFEKTAAEFDHIFTTDSDCISKYNGTFGSKAKTVASLPFYAQPKLQNPLPGNRPYDHSVAYGGSYYGDKYKKRSQALAQLLESSSNEGLTIYDRQHMNPDSPYKFPTRLQKYVVGGLTYAEMLNAYKSHPVHINVNSVDSSPTMFSRRVVEIAASGTAVLSGDGRGVTEVLNGVVPVITNSDDATLLVSEWMSNESARIRDSWLSYRSIHRAHTAAHRLSYVFRTAGLVVRAPELPVFAVYIPVLNNAALHKLNRQTAMPTHVYYSSSEIGHPTAPAYNHVRDYSESVHSARSAGIEWIIEFSEDLSDRTIFEDLLVPSGYGEWSKISLNDRDLADRGLGLVTYGPPMLEDLTMVRTAVDGNGDNSCLQMRRSILREQVSQGTVCILDSERERSRILVAGHDLKFAAGIIQELENRGHEVLIDQWRGHSQHDEVASMELLSRADVVFCEWSLGNAAWYSRMISDDQRLVVRLHSQEIFTQYLHKTDLSRVDRMIFVGQHIADIAIRDFDVPREIVQITPNYVDLDLLNLPKLDGSQWNIGLVGIVPQGKRLDLALDLLAFLRQRDDRYRLFIKGRRPEEYSWMKDRPDEMKFYEEQYSRIEADARLRGAVSFDPFDDKMAEWYTKIGTVISVSDFESFHLTLADGAASGSLAQSIAWSGADQIYPTDWLSGSIVSMGNRILELSNNPIELSSRRDSAQLYVEENFGSTAVLATLCDTILGESD